jgi:hypothetical protein
VWVVDDHVEKHRFGTLRPEGILQVGLGEKHTGSVPGRALERADGRLQELNGIPVPLLFQEPAGGGKRIGRGRAPVAEDLRGPNGQRGCGGASRSPRDRLRAGERESLPILIQRELDVAILRKGRMPLRSRNQGSCQLLEGFCRGRK